MAMIGKVFILEILEWRLPCIGHDEPREEVIV